MNLSSVNTYRKKFFICLRPKWGKILSDSGKQRINKVRETTFLTHIPCTNNRRFYSKHLHSLFPFRHGSHHSLRRFHFHQA